MKLLYVYSKNVPGVDLIWSFIEEGNVVDPYKDSLDPVVSGEERENITKIIYDRIKEGLYEGVISWNYFAAVSDACEKAGIPYISWIFDSPLLHVYSSNMKNSCNYIFTFDRPACVDIKSKGGNAFYLPLAVNTSRLGALEITDDDIANYTRDISFVGSLYQKNPYNQIKELPEHLDRKFQDIFIKQIGDWKHNYLYTDVTDADMEELKKYAPIAQIDEYPYISLLYEYAGFFLARQFASIERPFLLNRLASKYNITLYNGKDNTSILKGVEVRGAVEYEKVAPKVFFSSKINLNMTLRSIEEGIPLRAFDVMGVGGFLLSNYQKAFEELFEPDVEMVMYSSLEELTDKAGFYLTHENARIRIAMNGYKKICREHTMRRRAREMMERVYGNK